MKPDFLLPRYWLIWLFYGAMRLSVFLPFRIQTLLGRLLGHCLMAISPQRRRIARINLGLCFPEWDEKKVKQVLRQNAGAMGLSVFEFAMAHWYSDDRIRQISEIEGVENLQNALAQKRGVILLVGHFTTMEIMSRILRLQTIFHPVYRKFNNPLVEYLIKRSRLNHIDKVIEHDDMRSIVRSLRSNVPVFYIPDRNFGRKYALFVPFFGIPTATIPATSRLAGLYHSPVLPLVQQRLPGGRGYKLIIQPPLENFPTNDLQSDTARISKIIEDQVRQNPADYLWVHRRFKTRPEGEPPVY